MIRASEGSIVEPQGLHQDYLNSLSYNGLKTPIIIAHVYDILNTFTLGQVGVGSNISQNHSSSIQGVISGHYLPKFTGVEQK